VLTRQGYRWLTPLEFERLQSFPDGWTEGIPEGQRYKCMGNAVNVTVVERGIARPLKTALARSRRANAERRSRD
jgi:DNA (cytosine-5)-methyltransferase 1